MKFGLENISKLCAELSHPERAFQSVIIGGTNGKGSVAAMTHRALRAAGHASARYTSPHLERIEERYVVGDGEVGGAELEATAIVVRAAVERLQQRGELCEPPTFFEAATALAFELFRRASISVAVLEVGLGGRLDATNVVTPVAAAITSVDFDHQAQLGDTLEAIAFEKAGIVKPGIPVICGGLPPGAEAVIREICEERSARFIGADAVGDPALQDVIQSPGLRGAHQRRNAAVAARLLRELDSLGLRISDDAIRSGLTDVDWPGRLELFDHDGAEVLIDAAHNPAGARALALYLREIGWDACAFVFGAMQDKNVAGMLAELTPVCRELVCTTAATPRAMQAEALARIAAGIAGARWQISVRPVPDAALAHAVRRFPRVVVAGSIFLIGPLRGILRTR